MEDKEILTDLFQTLEETTREPDELLKLLREAALNRIITRAIVIGQRTA